MVINASEQRLNKTLLTSLPEGRYCNVLTGGLDTKKPQCTGGEIVIDDAGQLKLSLPAMQAVAIHHNARLTSD